MSDPDETIRITPKRRVRRPHRLASALTGLSLIAFSLAWFVWPARIVDPPPPHNGAAALVATAGLPTATEAEILASAPTDTEIRRFAPQPQIVILHFPTLADQALTLNRAAAMVERAGYPRDRVLDGAELDRRIRDGGDTPDTLYFGHDYRAADLLRFFDTAARTGQPLTAHETRLRGLIEAWGWREGTSAALISLVRDEPAIGLDRPARATILRHELSHGLYFTSPDYAAYARQFWTATLTEAERARFRGFLAGEGYDTGIEDLMINETQAYLMHTPDPRFFSAAALGLPPARLDALRVLFLTGMPPSWLRDCTALPTQAP